MIELLRQELKDAGFQVDRGVRSLLSMRIMERGELEFERLRRTMGRQIDSFRNSTVQSMGVGAALTEFTTAVLPLSENYFGAVTTLGGLTCLIVSAFDAIVDSGTPPPDVFAGRTPGQSLPAQVVGGFVEEYFRQLEMLPQENRGIRALLERTIHKMHAAELQSAGEREISRGTWWRKNALPFVVMSLPAWLTMAEPSACDVRKHLRLVGRMGEFLGWIDDCVDFDEDVRQGHANRLGGRLQFRSESHCASRIAAQGRRVLGEWDLAGGPAKSRDILATVVWSWLQRGSTRCD